MLACVGTDRAAVRVAYAPDGSLDITMQGAMRGTPEERCVQEALDGVRVETSETDGYGAARALYARCAYPEAVRMNDFYRPGDALIVYYKRIAGEER